MHPLVSLLWQYHHAQVSGRDVVPWQMPFGTDAPRSALERAGPHLTPEANACSTHEASPAGRSSARLISAVAYFRMVIWGVVSPALCILSLLYWHKTPTDRALSLREMCRAAVQMPSGSAA